MGMSWMLFSIPQSRVKSGRPQGHQWIGSVHIATAYVRRLYSVIEDTVDSTVLMEMTIPVVQL